MSFREIKEIVENTPDKYYFVCFTQGDEDYLDDYFDGPQVVIAQKDCWDENRYFDDGSCEYVLTEDLQIYAVMDCHYEVVGDPKILITEMINRGWVWNEDLIKNKDWFPNSTVINKEERGTK